MGVCIGYKKHKGSSSNITSDQSDSPSDIIARNFTDSIKRFNLSIKKTDIKITPTLESVNKKTVKPKIIISEAALFDE